MTRWTKKQEDYLCANWGGLPDKEVAAQLGRTVLACEQKAYLLDIRRSDNPKYRRTWTSTRPKQGRNYELVEGVTTKTCTKCGETKSVEDFARNRQTRDGRAFWCRLCLNANTKACRQRKIEHYRAKNRAWNDSHRAQLYAAHKAWLQRHPDYRRDSKASA